MMVPVLACLLLSLATSSCVAQDIYQQCNYTSFDGFDIIFLDTPSYLTTLHADPPWKGLTYVFGEDTFRFVYTNATTNEFEAVAYSPIKANQPFISFSLFHNGTYPNLDLFITGPVYPSGTAILTPPRGYTIPVALLEPGAVGSVQNLDLNETSLYSIWTDWYNSSDVCSYYVGWVPSEQHPLQLGLVRTHVNMIGSVFNRDIGHNRTIDYAALGNDVNPLNKFIPYDQTFKPWIYPLITQINGQDQLTGFAIIDPATRTISQVDYHGNDQPLVYVSTYTLPAPTVSVDLSIVSTRLSFTKDILYIGWAGQGINPGGISSVYLRSGFPIAYAATFWEDPFMSRPQALSVDDGNGDLYIGFRGGNVILKYTYDLQYLGIQNLPFYLTEVHDALTYSNWSHVMFITYEQHSKIFRVNKTDFCPKTCQGFDTSAYCSKGKCVCATGWEMITDKHSGDHCELIRQTVTITVTNEEKGAVAALSVLFVISFVLAVVGWFMVYKARKN